MIKTVHLGNYSIQDCTSADLGHLESFWRDLEKGADMTAFQSFDWYKNLAALYQQEQTKNLFRKHRYILVLKEERPVLLAPLQINPLGIGYKKYGAPHGVFFIGRLGYTDYLNFIYDVFDSDALEALIGYVVSNYGQKRFFLDRMPENSASYRYLTANYPGQPIAECFASLILPDSFEAYRKSLSKSTRQNIRTAINRAEKNGIRLTHTLILDEDQTVKDQITALNAQRLSKKAKASRQQMSLPGRIYCFFAELYRKLFSAKPDVVNDSKNTFSFLVNDGEKLVAFFWGIRNDQLKEYHVILAGVHKDYEWYSPAISHLYLFIEEYYQTSRQDIRILDFTRGGEGYKKKIGCTDRPVSGFYWIANKQQE